MEQYEEMMLELQQLISRLNQPKKKKRSPYSIYETETSVIAALRLPGFPKEDIELFLTDDLIEVQTRRNIQGEIQIRKSHEELPARVDPEKAEASYKEGMLRVEIPKLIQEKKKIEIG